MKEETITLVEKDNEAVSSPIDKLVEGFYFSDDDDLQVQQESAATKDPFFEKEDVFTSEMDAFLEQYQEQLATFQSELDITMMMR